MHVGGATNLLLEATRGLQPLLAGMPTAQLTEWGSLRLQSISFFAMGFLLSSVVVWKIWNSLQRDFPRLPRLSFGKATGLVFLWGLLFIVVLTMISGARELMTPGAWVKQGATYKLRSAEPQPAEVAQTRQQRETAESALAARRTRLERLKEALWKYADEHEGKFPTDAEATAISDPLWLVDEQSGLRFIYRPGDRERESARPLAFEPEVVDPRPWVLLSNGEIEQRNFEAIFQPLTTGITE